MTIPASSHLPAIDARQLLNMNYAFAQTALLIAAVRLRLFTILAETPLNARELAGRMHIDTQALERLLRGLHMLELLSQEGDVYQLTPLADRFLVEGKGSYLIKLATL